MHHLHPSGGVPRVNCGYSGRTSPVRTSKGSSLRACHACRVALATLFTWCDLARSRRGGYSADAPCTAPPPVSEGCRALTVANRDEPARFGHLQITLCARAALVGSPGSPPARGAISRDLAVAVAAPVHHFHPSEGCRALTLATRDEPARVRHLQTTLCACAALVGSPGSPIHVVRSRAISPWRLQRRASPPPVGGMPRIDSLATRDEPARFGHIEFTLWRLVSPWGRLSHSLQVVRCDLAVAAVAALDLPCYAKAKKGRIRAIPASRLKGSSCGRFHFDVRHSTNFRCVCRCSRGHTHVGAGSAVKSRAGWSLQSPAGCSRTRVSSPNQP